VFGRADAGDSAPRVVLAAWIGCLDRAAGTPRRTKPLARSSTRESAFAAGRRDSRLLRPISKGPKSDKWNPVDSPAVGLRVREQPDATRLCSRRRG
jgi:hypothetical protein